jgi:hypothetical protein
MLSGVADTRATPRRVSVGLRRSSRAFGQVGFLNAAQSEPLERTLSKMYCKSCRPAGFCAFLPPKYWNQVCHATMESSTYSNLLHDNREIRTVTILPSADPSMPIRCVSLQVSLNKPPGYLALSYACGDPTVIAPIFLDDVVIHVTTNLEAALRHIRLPTELCCCIDAICINQADLAERSQQVQLMRIYTLKLRV